MYALTNWKTTAAGVLSMLVAVASLVGVSVPGLPTIAPDVALNMIIAGVIGVLAKDANVTGGSVKQ